MKRTPISAAIQKPLQTFAPAIDPALLEDKAVHQFVGWLTRFPDPDEVLRKAGLTRASLRILETDDEVAQCIDTRREAIIATPWRVEPYPSPAAEFIIEQLDEHIEPLIRGAFDALLFGYSVVEVVYEKQGSRIGIAHLSEKPFEWFEPRHDGSLIYTPETGDKIECDPRKFFLTRRQASYRQPYGEAMLSALYWTVFFKTHGRKKWAQLLERYAEPLLVGKVRDQQKFIDDIISLGIAAGLPIQPEDDISAIHATQAGEFERFENALSRSIQKLVLGQTLTSDVGDSGSYAAAKVHDQVRQDKRHADIRLVSPTIQDVIDTLCDLNRLPRLDFEMADDTGLEEARAARDALLVEKGIVKLTKDYILDKYDFKEEHIEIAEAAPMEPEEPEEPEETEEPEEPEESAEMAAKLAPRFTPEQQVIEDATDKILAKRLQPLKAESVAKAIAGAKDQADLAARLGVLLDEQNPEFIETLARAQFAAQAYGFVTADKEGPLEKPADPLDLEIKRAELDARRALVEALRRD